MDKLGINLGFLIVQILNFAVMFVILRKWAFIPIMNTLDQRRLAIEKGLEDARVAAQARENAEEEAKKVIGAAQTKASEIVREATERAEVTAKEISVAASAVAELAKEAALADAIGERDRMLKDVRGQVGSLALAATHKLVGEALDEQRQRALIDQFFSGVREGKVEVLEGFDKTDIAGEIAEITSALPLTDAEKEVVKKDLAGTIGNAASIVFRVDPSILGGLIFRVGDKVMDGSVSGQLIELEKKLK